MSHITPLGATGIHPEPVGVILFCLSGPMACRCWSETNVKFLWLVYSGGEVLVGSMFGALHCWVVGINMFQQAQNPQNIRVVD